MIRSFRHKGLAEFFATGQTARIRPDLKERVRARLSALNVAGTVSDLDVPGFRLHRLHGTPRRHALSVNGPWRITFEWVDGDAWRVDLEQYH